MDMRDILAVAARSGASDIHIKVGLQPLFRVDGQLVPLRDAERVTAQDALSLANQLMTPEQQEFYLEHRDIDFAFVLGNQGRFRVNIFQQRGHVGMVLRLIPLTIPDIDTLHLPRVIGKLAMEQRGLILVTGTTGSGKSTTLAAMVDHINVNRSAHVMTIEDPIEFAFRDKRSIINQREVGVDCADFASGLRAALRQDPDVILVGEMRDLETIETALLAAETGHLVMSTLHTLDAAETINRIIMAFPPHQQGQIRIQLAGIIRGIISQRLVARADKKGRVAAQEIMLNTEHIRELIEDPSRTKELTDVIAKGNSQYEMQTFDQSLLALLRQNLITYEEAVKQCTNPDDFALRFSGITSTDDWEIGAKGSSKDG